MMTKINALIAMIVTEAQDRELARMPIWKNEGTALRKFNRKMEARS